jgi:hypothetical protein
VKLDGVNESVAVVERPRVDGAEGQQEQLAVIK